MFYKIFKEKISSEEWGDYLTYGIYCGSQVKISDVCTDYKSLEGFVDTLNELKVDPKHITYFIKEFLKEKERLVSVTIKG